MTHTIPTVGVTHDVVVYPGGSAHPVGLVIVPYTYRLGVSAPLVPRMSIGATRGLDYSTFMSWVQDTWEGRSGLKQADGMGYRNIRGFYPALPGHTLRIVPYPPIVEIGVIYGSAAVAIQPFTSPYGRSPTPVFNVASDPLPFFPRWPSETRMFMGSTIVQPHLRYVNYFADMTLPVVNSIGTATERWYARDAVSHSTVAFISTYAYSATEAAAGAQLFESMPARTLLCHSHAAVWSPVGTTTAGVLGVYDKKVWRSEPYGHRIAYYTPAQTSNSYWSEWIDVQAGVQINNMQEFIGRLMLGCFDGLYAYEAGRTYEVVSFATQASVLNFSILASLAGSLWFNIQRRMFRYTSGGLLEELDLDFAEGEYPVSICGGNNCVYVVAASFVANQKGRYPRSLYRIDTGTGATSQILDFTDLYDTGKGHSQSPLVPVLARPSADDMNISQGELATNPILIAPMITSTYAQSQRTMCGIMFGADLGISPPDTNRSIDSLYTTGFIAGNYRALNKSWSRARITSVVPVGSSLTIHLGYRRYPSDPAGLGPYGDGFAYLSPQGFTNATTLNLRDVKLLSKQLELSVYVYGSVESTVTTDVQIQALELDYLLAGPLAEDGNLSRSHTFQAVVTDGLQLWNAEVENSAAWVTAMMYSIADSRLPHVVAFPYPPPLGHTAWATVELAQGGVAVPVLSYQTTSCQGSDLPLIIREV